LLKGASPALLAEAVRAAHAGDALISPQVTLRLLRHVASGQAPAGRQPVTPLSDREIEVVQAIARGRTNTEIASDLFISLSTVKSHLASIHNKLSVRNRVEIAGWAWETGLVQPGSAAP
jgi:DNA-binding NarL/FixJ family response regulator